MTQHLQYYTVFSQLLYHISFFSLQFVIVCIYSSIFSTLITFKEHNGQWQMFSLVDIGQRLAFSMVCGQRRHSIKIFQLTESEMTASFLGGRFPFAFSDVDRMAVISVRSANECLVGRMWLAPGTMFWWDVRLGALVLLQQIVKRQLAASEQWRVVFSSTKVRWRAHSWNVKLSVKSTGEWDTESKGWTGWEGLIT